MISYTSTCICNYCIYENYKCIYDKYIINMSSQYILSFMYRVLIRLSMCDLRLNICMHLSTESQTETTYNCPDLHF